MENPEELALTIGFVIGVTLLFSLWTKKKMKQEWQGQLIDKKVKKREDNQGFDQTSYELKFKTDEGKVHTIKVQQAMYDMWKIGDMGEKKSGEWWPKRV